MKKFILLAIAFITLQSCSVTNVFTFHNDGTISTDMTLDMSEMLAMEAKAKQGENSLKNVNMPKFPKEWQSVYDFQKTIGSKDSISEEEATLLKRSMIKGLFKDDKEVGFELRFSHFPPEQFASITTILDKGKQKNTPLQLPSFKWEGKELHIDMNVFDSKNDDEQAERLAQMKKMFDIELNNTLVFENKIKKIKGKHPFIQKIDAHTIKIDVNDPEGKKKKKRDNEIVIITK